MNLQWILLAFFIVAIVSEIFKAITQPMHKNVLNLISIPVAFIITFIIQVAGLFQAAAATIVDAVLGIVQSFVDISAMDSIGTTRDFIVALLSTLLAPVLFVSVYSLILFIIRLVHVNLLVKFIESRQEKKERRLLKLAVREEKSLVKKIIRENQEQTIDIIDDVVDGRWDSDVLADYDLLSSRDIDRMIDKRIKREKRARKKRGFFKESKEKKSISIIVAAISGFLAFAIAWMPIFYTMSVVSSLADGIDPDDDENIHPVYLAVDFMDEHILTPYEESFVYQIYDSMGLIDLMNDRIVPIGGTVEINGKEVQANLVVRGLLVNLVKVFTQVTSSNPNETVLRNALSAILVDDSVISPMIIDAIYNAIADLTLTDVNIPLVGDMFSKLIQGYQQDKQLISKDIDSLVEMIVVLTKQHMISNLISGNLDFEGMLSDKDSLKELVGAMAGLSLFGVLMETAFNAGVDMIMAPDSMLLPMPATKEDGYNKFVQKIVDASESLSSSSSMTPDQIANLKTFFEQAATYEKSANNNSNGILAYIVDPLYQAELLKAEVDELQKLYDDYTAISDELKALQSKEDPTAEDLQKIADLIAQQKELIGDKNLDEAINEAQAKLDGVFDKFNLLVSEFKTRFGNFAPFITYFVNWNSVQKPFMLSGVDKSSAPISISVNGAVYVCNTDEINIEKIIDLLTGDGLSGDVTLPEFGNSSDILNMKVDDILPTIPMRELIESLNIVAKTENDNIELSPVAELINFLIEKYSVGSPEILTVETLKSKVLPEFILVNTDDTAFAEILAGQIVNGTFEFEGITVESIKNSLRFGDDWTDELRKSDAANLVDVIFSLVDVIGSMTGSEETVDPSESEQNPEDVAPVTDDAGDSEDTGNTEEPGDTEIPDDSEDTDSGLGGEFDAILDLFATLGEIFDAMHKTYSLEHLPRKMIEAIFTHDMLSMAITPSMLHDYTEQLDAIDNGEGTYAQFMTDFVEKIEDLLGKFSANGGVVG